MNDELDMKWIQPVVVRFDVHPVLVLRPTCVPEKVGVTLKRRKSKIIFPFKRFKYIKNQQEGVKQKMSVCKFGSFVSWRRTLKQKGVKQSLDVLVLFGNLPGETLKNIAETSASRSRSELEPPDRSDQFVGLLCVIRHISKQN
jgi:hypothetical protein